MYRVIIRNNETREIRTREYGEDWDDSCEWLWTEGNFGCDCNRSLEFALAAGEHPKLEESDECSENRYTVLCVELPSGQLVSIDDIENRSRVVG